MESQINNYNKDNTLLHFEKLACAFYFFDKSKEFKFENLCNKFNNKKVVNIKILQEYFGSPHEDFILIRFELRYH